MMEENLFAALFKYGHGAGENYLTESFVFLMKLLIERSPAHGIRLIRKLCHLLQKMCCTIEQGGVLGKSQ